MLQTRFGRTLTGAAVSVAALLGLAGPAQATLYKGAWDPAFGSPFTNLGWNGSAIYDIPTGCVPTGAGTVVLTSSTCAGMSTVSAEVGLYSLTGPASSETLTFDSAFVITKAVYVNGTLVEVDTGFSATQDASIPAATLAGGLLQYEFALAFTAHGAELFYTADLGCLDCKFSLDMTPVNNSWYCGVSDYFNNPAVVTITPVPEPSTYALMLAGLGAVGFVARRRRQ